MDNLSLIVGIPVTVYVAANLWMFAGALFHLPPRPSLAKNAVLDRVFADAPPPGFRRLTMEKPARGRTEAVQTEWRLVRKAGWRSVFQEIAPVVEWMPAGQELYVVGIPALFESARGGRWRPGWIPHRFLQRVETVEAEGTLFPLAQGNQLRITASSQAQQWMGPIRTQMPSTATYDFEVAGTSEQWPQVPGPVFVIRVKSEIGVAPMDLEVEEEKEIHFSAALGAVILTRHGNVDGPRLVSWE